MPTRRREAAEASSDDEEHFQKKERARLQQDRAQLAPVMLGGAGLALCHCWANL